VINDVSALSDPDMAGVVAAAEASVVLVHNCPIAPGQDLLAGVIGYLKSRIELAEAIGIAPTKIMVDPGLGFNKGWRENFELIRRLSELRCLGKSILVGPSRKGMIGRVLGVDVRDRLEGTAALVVLAIAGGASIVRVHDVLPMVRVARMTDALVRPD
jgi:dihydropteroate synthase